MDDERHLVDAALEGDELAIAAIVRRLQPAVWRVCAALGSPGEEEDLVQETFIRALRALPSFRRESSLRVWVLSIARRVCADHVRRKMRRRALVRRLGPLTDTTPGPDGSIADLVARLSPDRREAFVLTQVAALSYEEAAAVLGCPIGTVRSRVARARADLLAAVLLSESGS